MTFGMRSGGGTGRTSIDNAPQPVARVRLYTHTCLRKRAWAYPGSKYRPTCRLPLVAYAVGSINGERIWHGFATRRIHHRITTNAQIQPLDAFGVSLQCTRGLECRGIWRVGISALAL